MSPRVALVVRSNREGVARLPQALRAAGMHVTLFAAAGSFPAATSHRDALFLMRSPSAAPLRLLEALRFLWRMQRATPRMAIAGCEPALRYFFRLDEFMRSTRLDRVLPRAAAGIRAGLPARATFRELLSRASMSELAARCGIATPPWATAADTAAVSTLAREHGFPVIVKRDLTCAGVGVTCCGDASALAAALATTPGDGIVQAFLRGTPAMQAAVALNGRLLDTAGWAKERCFPEPYGPSSIVSRIEQPSMVEAARKFAEETLFNGFFSLDFVVSEGSPRLIEVNPRPTPVCHLGGLSHTLCLALGGLPSRAAPMPPARIAIFPQELRRNPASADDPDLAHDIPADDPQLVRALCDAYFDGRMPDVRKRLE